MQLSANRNFFAISAIIVTSVALAQVGQNSGRATALSLKGQAGIQSSQSVLLSKHRAALKAVGIQRIGNLGSLNFSGNVLAQAGVATPADQTGNVASRFNQARKFDRSSGTWTTISGTAKLAKARAVPTLRSTNGQPLYQNTAYWAAHTVNLPDNTNVILQYPNKFLVIIADKISVGQNVTITYDRGPVNLKPKPTTPVQPGTPAQTVGTGNAGSNGPNGSPGETGDTYAADPGPEFELWTLDMMGSPAVDARGQDGGPGGPGGDGAKGGSGGKGKNAVRLTNNGFDGGPGGKGGRGGNGGRGGDGSKGGRVSFFAPQGQITELTNNGYTWEISGGNGGVGGPPGTPGAGGEGGTGGDGLSGVTTKSPGDKGATGAQGDAGPPGASGQSGVALANAVRLVAISSTDFDTELAAPHIETIAVPSNLLDQIRKDDLVTVNGKNFAPGDSIVIADGQSMKPCVTQFIADTTLQCTVPAVTGGSSYIQVRRGTALSDKKSVVVMPTLDADQIGMRMKPGEPLILHGSGFKANSRIYVSWGQNAPVEVTNDKNGTIAVSLINGSSLQWSVTRPPNKSVGTNEAFGEAVRLTVKWPDGTASNTISVNYDNYLMLVVGDSMAWGTGLEVTEKHFTQVGQRIQQKIIAPNTGRLQLITVVAAHTGATVGWNDSTILPPIYGEVPTSYPTIKAELADFNAPNKAPYVDLIIAFGGVNDIGFKNVMDPKTENPEIKSQCDQFLHDDMKSFLQDAASKFTSAKIVVCGYQLVFSKNSDFSSATAKLLYTNILGHLATAKNEAKSVKNSYTFRDYGNGCLARAVSEINSGISGPPRLFFAEPGFGDDNGLYAPNSWLFSPSKIGTLSGAKVYDPAESSKIRQLRKSAVDANRARCPDKNFGYCASTGHPNQAGAQRYAQAILTALGI